MSIKEIILGYLSEPLQAILSNVSYDFFEHTQEIRLRVGKPVFFYKNNEEYALTLQGIPSSNLSGSGKVYLATNRDILKTLDIISDYSLYAFEEELRNGYITVQGGHRIGITGRTVLDKGSVKTLRNINGLNIRISHEIKGCADNVLKYMDKPRIAHTMVISPPGCGKTTLLRDMIRQISDGGLNVAVVDERSELGGCFQGAAQNDLGQRTDILDACPKAEGMLMLLRSMAPQVIAVDEIGRANDIHAIDEIVNAGITLLCTVHGCSLEDVRSKPVLSDLIARNIFSRYIILSRMSGAGTISAIYNGRFENIYCNIV